MIRSRTLLATVFVAATAFGSGCMVIPVQVQSASAVPGEAREDSPFPDGIGLYRSTKPDRPYREVGVVFASGTVHEDYAPTLRKAAAGLGGDAIIEATFVLSGMIGTVIVWEDSP